MAIDQSGYLYATDADSIQKFTNMGDFIIKWSNSGDDTGKFKNPARGGHRYRRFCVCS